VWVPAKTFYLFIYLFIYLLLFFYCWFLIFCSKLNKVLLEWINYFDWFYFILFFLRIFEACLNSEDLIGKLHVFLGTNTYMLQIWLINKWSSWRNECVMMNEGAYANWQFKITTCKRLHVWYVRKIDRY